MKTIVFDASYVLMDSLAFKKERNVQNNNGDIIGGSLLTLIALRNTLKKYNDYDRLIIAWDGGPSERKRELEPNYRTLNVYWKESIAMLPESNEPERHNEYITQQNILKDIFNKAGILQIDIPTLEKEDIIPYLLHEGDGNEYLFATDDHSFNVLLGDNVYWYRPFENIEIHKRALMLNRFIKDWKQYCLCQAIGNHNLDMVKGSCDFVGETYMPHLLNIADIVGYDEFEKMGRNEIKEECEKHNVPYRSAYENFKADRVDILDKIYGYTSHPGYFITEEEKKEIDDKVESWNYNEDNYKALRDAVKDSIVDLDMFDNEQLNFRFYSDTKDMFE